MPIALMLATLTDRRDFGEDWLLERKFDGERCVARKAADEVRLESRTARDLTGAYPEIREAIAGQPDRELLLDGEIVAFDGEQTSFGRLQQRLGVATPSPELVARYPVVFCIFDLLELDGDDLRGRPLLERRARLTEAIRPGAALRLSEAWRDDPQGRFARACQAGWEGLIAKRAQAPYTAGRSRDWLKLKCVWEQEFVIGGYTDPAGSRTDFGALLVGYYEGARLGTRARLGPGTPLRRSATLALGCVTARRPSRRSPTLGRFRAERIGSDPSSSPRSASPSGRTTLVCANRASSACATTSSRPRSSGSGPGERPHAAGDDPRAPESSSRAWFSASVICLPPIPRKPPSLCALATACAMVITKVL